MDLQELIRRGRFLFSNAAGRFAVFNLVNGRRTARDIALSSHRAVENVHRDLKRLNDGELIRPKMGADRRVKRSEGFTVYEKVPLARTVPVTYFLGRVEHAKRPTMRRKHAVKARAIRRQTLQPVPVPNEKELIDILSTGEDQNFEFKSAGTEVRKVTKEIAAMLNTKQGGIIFYGVDDNGKAHGTDLTRQQFDQPLQNSVRNSIDPPAVVALKSVSVLGNEVLVIVVPPWNGTEVYLFDEKVLIRKGTSTFAAKAREMRKLFLGESVI
jgi:Putative DNA-binding domain